MAKEVLKQGFQENYGVCCQRGTMIVCSKHVLFHQTIMAWEFLVIDHVVHLLSSLDKWKRRKEHFSFSYPAQFPLNMSISLSVEIINQIPINCACQSLCLHAFLSIVFYMWSAHWYCTSSTIFNTLDGIQFFQCLALLRSSSSNCANILLDMV